LPYGACNGTQLEPALSYYSCVDFTAYCLKRPLAYLQLQYILIFSFLSTIISGMKKGPVPDYSKITLDELEKFKEIVRKDYGRELTDEQEPSKRPLY